MRKRVLTKRVVFVAICLTVVVIWQRQWLTDDNITDIADNAVLKSAADTGSLSGYDVETHRVIYRRTDYPRINEKRTSNDYPRIQRMRSSDLPAEDFHFNRTTSIYDSIKRNKKEDKSDETKNWHRVEENEFQTSISGKQVLKNSRTPVRNEVVDNSDGEIDEDLSNIEKVFEEESQLYTPTPTKVTTDNHARAPSTPKFVPKTLPEGVELSNKVKENISNEDDDDDLAGFIAQQNFRRRGEEFSQNASALLRNEGKELQSGSEKTETIKSKPNDSQPSAENDLLKMNGIVIKDDSSDFLGQIPVFEDVLPIRNNSSPLTDDRNLQKDEEKLEIPLKKDEDTSKIDLEQPSVATDEEVFSDGEYDKSDDVNMDPLMDGVIVLGNVTATRKYAVFSTTTENRDSLSFIFYVPLTVLAWKRIGFDSVLIIVGSKDEWDADPLLYHVLSTARLLDCVVIFLEPRPEKSVMISQVARIFAANILRSTFRGIDDVYLVTSDTDIWPIYGDVYALPPGKRILSLNSDCCTPFKHRGATYKMLPMANIGMSIRSWRRITRKFGDSPKTIDDILTYFVQEFGTVALRPVHKGDNVGWYLDQMMISILVSKWVKELGVKTVKFVPRDVGVDRIDRAGWSFGQNSIKDKVDAHLLLEAYVPGVWVRVTHLLRAMYGDMTERYVWCVNYYETFQRLFLEKYRSNART